MKVHLASSHYEFLLQHITYAQIMERNNITWDFSNVHCMYMYMYTKYGYQLVNS